MDLVTDVGGSEFVAQWQKCFFILNDIMTEGSFGIESTTLDLQVISYINLEPEPQ